MTYTNLGFSPKLVFKKTVLIQKLVLVLKQVSRHTADTKVSYTEHTGSKEFGQQKLEVIFKPHFDGWVLGVLIIYGQYRKISGEAYLC